MFINISIKQELLFMSEMFIDIHISEHPENQTKHTL